MALIKYHGFEDDFYCYRIQYDGMTGIDVIEFERTVTDWLWEHATGKHFMGNEFPYNNHPKFSTYNPKYRDVFLAFDKITDVILFEERFEIEGVCVSDLSILKNF